MTDTNGRSRIKKRMAIAIGICCLALVGASIHLVADRTDTSIEDVRRLYERLSAEKSPTGFVHVQYTVHSVMRDSVLRPPTTSDIDLIVGPHSMKAVSAEMEMYKDTSATVTILPSRHTIYIATSNATAFQAGGLERFQQLRDSVLQESHLIESETRTVKEGVERSVAFQPATAVRNRLGFDRVTIAYDPRESALRRFRIDYKSGQPIAWVETSFSKIDYSVDPTSIQLPVTDQVLSGSGELRPKYEGYRLVDLRK